MKARHTVTLAMMAGFGLGAVAVQALHAQAVPPAYVITLFDTQIDMSTHYPSLAPASFQPFGGHYIIHGGRTVTFDGNPPKQFVVIEFDSMEKAQAWRASDAFKQRYDLHRTAKVRAFAVEGVNQ
jgi:uncharacterized protein (DUF1330 family)